MILDAWAGRLLCTAVMFYEALASIYWQAAKSSDSVLGVCNADSNIK
jgi:hypothetical protein